MAAQNKTKTPKIQSNNGINDYELDLDLAYNEVMRSSLNSQKNYSLQKSNAHRRGIRTSSIQSQLRRNHSPESLSKYSTDKRSSTHGSNLSFSKRHTLSFLSLDEIRNDTRRKKSDKSRHGSEYSFSSQISRNTHITNSPSQFAGRSSNGREKKSNRFSQRNHTCKESYERSHRDSDRKHLTTRSKQHKNFVLSVEDITRTFEQMNMKDKSDFISCSSHSPKKRHIGSPEPSQIHDKMSIHFIKVMNGKDVNYIIRKLKQNEEEFKNFFNSPVRREHMPIIFEFISRISSIDYELTKVSFMNTILNCNAFIENLRSFIDNFIEQCISDSEILKNIKLIVFFFEQISSYIPKEHLNNYSLLISKTLEICYETSMSKELITNLEICKKKLNSKIQLYEDEIITYKSLSVFPTKEELLNDTLLNIQNIVKGRYDNVNQYIDIQFKLLKEDYISGVRAGINQYLTDLEKKKKPINHDIFVYHKITYIGLSADDHPMKKVLHRFQLDPKPLKNVNWETSKRLIHGSLLFFTNNNFETLFMGVLDDKLKEESGSYNVIDVALVGRTLKIPLNSTFVMVESRVFFEPFYQVCNTMKDIQPQLFPLCKYIVYANTDAERPKYLNQNSHFIINNKEVSLNDIHSWPAPETIHLNNSQIAALHAALTREMVVIQGPPGTGKTYLGIKLINVLLDNKNEWSDGKSPIFVACYRNGAVDQILDSLASGKSGESRNVVRLGSRSTSDILKNCTLKNTVGHRRDPIMHDELNKLKSQLIEIKQNINELERCKTFVCEKHGILNCEVFQPILSQEQKHFFLRSYNIFETWLLEDDDDDNDFYTDEIDELISKLINESSNNNKKNRSKQKRYLSSTHAFVYISIDELASELLDLEWQLKDMMSEENKKDMSAMTILTDLIVQYNDKRDILKKIVTRIHMPNSNIDESVINSVDLQALKMNNRWSLYNYWAEQFFKFCEARIDELVEAHDIKLLDFLYKRDLNDGENLRAANVDVVGATTTGAARLNKLLTALKPKIVIIEEAAEVLEAHTITSLTEHCQHLILIGDHKQLKPSPASHTSVVKYHMDVSLFERMILNGMECFTLTQQHRMRPEISCLVSPYFYKNLSNHPSVEEYPDVKGMKKNLFFVDHKVSEDQLVDSDSHQNKYEAQLTLQVANYILQQGYEPNQVTILTLYIAQLLYLKSIKHKYPFLEDVEIQVVDNFQGEENDIIILSLVRSNSGSIGFLSKENRVCVALSRAKQGFYMLGNMETLQLNSHVWKEMRKILLNNSSLDSYLPLRCETHKRITKVNCVEDFYPLKNGGCSDECGLSLQCGHICNYICHPIDLDHAKSYKCNKPCPRKRNCNVHDCTGECGEDCPPCDVKIPHLLDCGHMGYRICAGEILQCHSPCPVHLECGHLCPKTCHKEDDHSEIECKAICGQINSTCKFLHSCPKLCQEECGVCMVDSIVTLDCGHIMKGICSEISKKKCTILTDKELLCGHIIEDECHKPINELICQEKIKVTLDCSHEAEILCGVNKDEINCADRVVKLLPCDHKVETLCSTPIQDVACTQPVKKTLRCGHDFENAPCSTPIDELICENQVTNTFDCGHTMTVNCGEQFPKCMVKVKVIDACGHAKTVACSLASDFKSNHYGSIHCKAKCTKILPCKHECSGTCGKCMQGRVHIKCNASCGDLLICGHKCSVACWNDFHACRNKCINSCEHKNCNRACGDICEKCMEQCTWACIHYKCKKKCWEVCDRPRCLFPCSKSLPCNHPCFGLCGETCPPICLICKPEDNMSVTDRYILLVDCNHVVSEKKLSALLEKTVGLVRCPQCSVPVVKTKFVKQHTKHFFSKFASVRSAAAALYNNKYSIMREFTRNFITLSEVLKNTFKDCEYLNKLLQILLERTLPIMQRKNNSESKLKLKTLLFICFYITDVLKMLKVEGISEENTIKFLNRVNGLAFYLVQKVEKQISPREMYEFSQELTRLKCMTDYMVLEQDIPSSGLSDSNILNGIQKTIFSLNELTNEDISIVINALSTVKNVVLSNHQLISAESTSSNKISEFFNKYYRISYHSNQWQKCNKGHNFYSKENSENLCPLCLNNTSNNIYFA